MFSHPRRHSARSFWFRSLGQDGFAIPKMALRWFRYHLVTWVDQGEPETTETTETDCARLFDRPHHILFALDPIGAHQLSPVFREQRPAAIRLGFLIEKAAPFAFLPPLLETDGRPP